MSKIRYEIAYTKAGGCESYIGNKLYEVWDEVSPRDFYSVVKYEDEISEYMGSYDSREKAEEKIRQLGGGNE